MASIKLRIRKSRVNAKGESPLFIQIFSGKTKKELSLGIAIEAENWDDVRSQVKRKNQRHGQLNAIIRSRTNELQNIIDDLLKKKAYITAEEIVKKYKSKPLFQNSDDTIITKFLEDHIKRNPESKKYSTLLTYGLFIKSFTEFKPNVTFSNLDFDLVLAYQKYLKSQKLANSTISNRMKILRRSITLANQAGIIKHNPMASYKRHKEKKSVDIQYLTIEEVKLIEAYKAPTQAKQKIIDLFLFRVYCGLRVSDQMTLNKSQVKVENGDIYLNLEMNKTRGRVSFKLNDKAMNIFEKYANTQTMYLFDILNERKNLKDEVVLLNEISKRTSYFNKVTKDMAELLEINKTITSHVARHTFATISLSIGISIHVVSNLLGHKSIKETQIYAKVLDSTKDAAIDLWNKI